MTYLKDLQEEIKEVGSLKELTEVYGEIASTRMKKIRGYVLRNREYLGSIKSIFEDTLRAYASKLSQLVREGKLKKGGQVTFLAHNGKIASVLISANTGFFGEVVKNTFNKFLDGIKNQDTEVTIIGRTGRSLFTSAQPQKPYVFFDLPDYGVDSAKLSEVIKHLVQYTEIRIYYGKFQSVITQVPQMEQITAGSPVSNKAEVPTVRYLFEPSVEDILMFFETQIFASIFDQSLRESQLAKFASRILAMDRANQNISVRIGALNLQKLKDQHKMNNTKQLNSLGPLIYK